MHFNDKYTPQEDENTQPLPQHNTVPPSAQEAPAAQQPSQPPQEAQTPSVQPPQEAQQQTPYQPPQEAQSPPVQQSQTPYQTPVRFSQDPPQDQPVYHDEAHGNPPPHTPFEPGSQSYTTYQQWQAQHVKKRKKGPFSKKPFIALGAVAAAAALFFGGMALGGGAGHGRQTPAASADPSLPNVSISSTPQTEGQSTAAGMISGDAIFEKLNASVVAIQSANSSAQSGSSGSGVVMSADGYIITNAHVVTDENTGQPMRNISVLFADGELLDATVRGYDIQTDLAVVKVEPKTPLVPAEFGDSDALKVGQVAYAIGSPGGVQLANTMTNGIISAINRDIMVNDRVMSLIQTNVTINPGNSGGALINQYGQVIGITSAKLGISYYEGLGFAIPMNSAKEIVDKLIQDGYLAGRPSIGITGESIQQGVLIKSVDSRSHAAAEGLLAGDIITGVNGQAITTVEEINKIKEGLQAGDQLKLTIYRPADQKSMGLTITLTDAHDLEGTDPATQQQQSNSYDRDSGSITPDWFDYYFGR